MRFTYKFHFLNQFWGRAECLYGNWAHPSWIRECTDDEWIPHCTLARAEAPAPLAPGAGARLSHSYLEVLSTSVMLQMVKCANIFNCPIIPRVFITCWMRQKGSFHYS